MERTRPRTSDAGLPDDLDYHLHFTPTSASWLNLVERFFAEITTKRIRRSAFCSVEHLERTITAYLDNRNDDPHPFVWTADADLILRRVAPVCERICDLRTRGVNPPESDSIR